MSYMKAVCGSCEEEFEILPSVYRVRKRTSVSGNLYCSPACSQDSKRVDLSKRTYDYEEIKALRAKGNTLREISLKTGASIATIVRVIQRGES